MSLKSKIKQLNDNDIKDAELIVRSIISDLIDRLNSNKRTVVWNYGLGVVVFMKDIDQIASEFLDEES